MTPIQVDDAINKAVENVAYVSNLSSDSSLVLADAESLGGLPAENYATKNYVVDTINQAQLGGDNSEVDLSIYATKDDLTLVRNAIPTTPEAIGAEVSGAAENALNNAKTYVNGQISAIDYPVDSVNGKTGDVTLSASDVGAAESSHNHAASNITSGTLPVAQGGTGATSAANARSNLGVAPATADTTYPNCYYRTVDGVKEWINPPMVAGVEYRTTERRRGSVVYTKLVEFGTFPNNNTASLNIGVAGTNICSVKASTFSHSNGEYQPLNMGYNGNLGAYFWVDNTGKLYVRAMYDLSNYYGVFQLRYVKN